jgi:hypothetical protein
MNDDRLLIEDYYDNYENGQLEQDALEIEVFAKGLIATFYMFMISGIIILFFLILKWSNFL